MMNGANEAAPLLDEANDVNVALPRFRIPRTKCFCPGFLCEMWSFIMAVLLLIFVALPTVVFFSASLFINQAAQPFLLNNTSAIQYPADSKLTTNWVIALSVCLHVVATISDTFAFMAAIDTSMSTAYMLLIVMGNGVQLIVSVVFFFCAWLTKIANLLSYFLISMTVFNVLLLPLPIILLLCEMRWEDGVDKRIAWSFILAQAMPSLYDTLVPSTVESTLLFGDLPGYDNSSNATEDWALDDRWDLGNASASNSTHHYTALEMSVSLSYLTASAVFCMLYSVVAATSAMFSKASPSSIGQRHMCTCVLVPFCIFGLVFYILWSRVIVNPVTTLDFIMVFPFMSFVTMVFAAAPTVSICFRLCRMARERRYQIATHPHPGPPPVVTTEQPLKSFQDASALRGLVVSPPSRSNDFALVWKTTDCSDDIASICAADSPHTHFGFYRPVPPSEGWVSLGDMCVVSDELQSMAGSSHTHAFDEEHLGTGGAMALNFGRLLVPAETYSLVWKNRPDTFRDRDDPALLSIWAPDDVTIGMRRYRGMGFVAVVGDDPPLAGACHVVLDSAVKSVRAEPRCEALVTLVDESSLGSVLFGKQNPLDGYAVPVALPPLPERWKGMCTRIRTATSLQTVEGEVKRVYEGDEKTPDHFPELEDHEDASLGIDARRELRVQLVQAVQVAKKRLEDDKWGATQKSALRRALGRLRVRFAEQHVDGARVEIYVQDVAWADGEAVLVRAAPDWNIKRLHKEIVCCVNNKRLRQQQKMRLGVHEESLSGVPLKTVSVASTMLLHAGRVLAHPSASEDPGDPSQAPCRPLSGSFVQCVEMGDEDWADLETENQARQQRRNRPRQCPAGHELQTTPNDSQSYGCNKCSQPCAGGIVHRCTACDYTVCSRCFRNAAPRICRYKHRFGRRGRLKMLLAGDQGTTVTVPKEIFSHAAARRRLNEQSIAGLKAQYRVRQRAWRKAQYLIPANMAGRDRLRSQFRHCTACMYFYLLASVLLMVPIPIFLSMHGVGVIGIYARLWGYGGL